MKRSEEEKIKLILKWYESSTKGKNNSRKIGILRSWIEICSQEEEYRVAATLKLELFRLRGENFIEHMSLLRILKVKFRQIWKRIAEKLKTE